MLTCLGAGHDGEALGKRLKGLQSGRIPFDGDDELSIVGDRTGEGGANP